MKMLIKYFYAIMNVLDLCLEGSITMEYSAAMTSRPYLYKETKIVASLFGFQEKPLYKATEGAQQVPEVNFSS